MRSVLHILLITIIAVGLSSCGPLSGLFGGNSEDASVTEDETAASSPSPDPESTDDPATTSDAATPADAGTAPEGDPTSDPSGEESEESFESPVVEETNPVGNVPLDLIASTDPEERLRLVQRDRPDPFDLLQTTPSLDVPEEVANPPAPPTPPANPTTGNGSNTDNLGTPGNGNGNGNGNGSNNPIPGGDGSLAPIPDLVPVAPPPPPEPETARAVTVTGVVQIGSVPYAIVDAPNEPYSRYVRSGQFLSNGQVLVKRIEMFPGMIDPVVILEEFGIEVARQVGDPGVGADATESDQPATPGEVVQLEPLPLIGTASDTPGAS